MQIIDMYLAQLKPYEKNPRKNEQAVDKVAASIKEFGFKVPIVIDKDGVIVAGHTRYKAAKKLGLDSVPCIVADDLTEEQIKAFRLADNKVGEFADWIPELLSDELAGIFDIDMGEFGFELDDSGEIVEDDYDPEPPEEPKAKHGDIYQLGRHRLMCGDSTILSEVQDLVGGVASTFFLQIRLTMWTMKELLAKSKMIRWRTANSASF